MSRRIRFGAHKLPRPFSFGEREERAREMLSRVLNLETTVAVVGNGLSRPLGYPSWNDFAHEILDRTIQDLDNGDASKIQLSASDLKAHVGRLKKLKGIFDVAEAAREAAKKRCEEVQAAGGDPKDVDVPSISADTKMYSIGLCQEISRLYPKGITTPFLRYLSERFVPASEEDLANFLDYRNQLPAHLNPYEKLVKLPIRRFVTTNYDKEIECALEKQGRTADSFTQKPENAPMLARFTFGRLAVPRNPMVFHCHGVAREPDSLVAGERDYQRWYVADDEGLGNSFRQTIRLLFESNPLLFIGYGLEDLDLLEPLRHLGAVDPGRKDSRPLFAIVPSNRNDSQDQFRRELLFERYGLHVISFDKPESDAVEVWAEAHCDQLDSLCREWQKGYDEWLGKPPARLAVVCPTPRGVGDGRGALKESCLVTRFEAASLAQVGTIPVGNRADDIVKAVEDTNNGIVVVIGPTGSGKSWSTVGAVDYLRQPGSKFSKVFYWNAHYENEALTALERILAFLPDDGEKPADFRALGERVRDLREPCLFAIDGCERLLVSDGKPGAGCCFSLTLRKILEAALHPDSQSVVILSGRLWPSDLEEIVATPEDGSEPRRLRSFHRIDVRPLEFKDLEAAGDDNPFAALDPRVQAELCSLLCGHDYALLLAAAYVDGRSADEIDDLCRRLAAKPPDHRHAAMVRVILKELESADAPESSAGGLEGDEGKDCRGRAGKGRYPLVGYLALFQSPFSKETLQACCELAGFDEDASQELVTQELMRKGLLFKILKGSGHPEGFTIHPMVRDFLAEEPEAFVTSRPPNFAISGFLSKFSGLSPGPRRFRRMTRVFEQLSTLIHDLIDEAPQPAAPAAEAGGDSKAIVLCRDLYGLLRSQADAIGASPRGERCTSYMVRGIVLAQLTKELFPTRELWRFRSHQRAAAYSASAPLYIAELLWLYNDIGTALFSEGLMPDAYAVWEQAYEIAKVIEGPHTPGKLTAEQEVNLCHTFLELGHVSVARGYLERARRICDTLGDAELTARITGYRAFFDHIQGNLSAADKRYGSACSQLDRSDNLRACSFFKTLHALLRLRLADHARAQQLANSARALAEAGGFPDLVVYSQIAEASVLKEKKMFTEARLEVNDALSRARKIGMRGIEAVLLQLLSRLVHAQGDAEGARHHALQSLRLANELGLGLVQTRGLLALGLATLATGDQELGMAYLDIAQQQAENQQYFLRARDIQHEYGLRAERWRPAARRESPGYRHQVP